MPRAGLVAVAQIATCTFLDVCIFAIRRQLCIFISTLHAMCDSKATHNNKQSCKQHDGNCNCNNKLQQCTNSNAMHIHCTCNHTCDNLQIVQQVQQCITIMARQSTHKDIASLVRNNFEPRVLYCFVCHCCSHWGGVCNAKQKQLPTRSCNTNM